MSGKALSASPTRPMSDGISIRASSTFDRLMMSMGKQKGGASSSTRLQPQLTYSLVLDEPRCLELLSRTARAIEIHLKEDLGGCIRQIHTHLRRLSWTLFFWSVPIEGSLFL